MSAEPSKKDILVAKYVVHLTERVGEKKPDMDLLEKCVKACGPTIYNADSAIVASSDPEELKTIAKGFVTKKLGVTDADAVKKAMDVATEKYGKSYPSKQRPVYYYLLAKALKKTDF